MKLEFIKEDALIALKSNLSSLVKYFSLQDNSWIIDFLGYSPFAQTKFSVNDFYLDMSQEKPFATEFENVKRVYSHLKFLSDSQASEEKLWAGLCLGPFWQYTQYRWNPITIESIRQHFFFGFGPRRSLTRNAVSRLWWIGRLTYDGKRSNPFELTELVCENADYIMHILERNTSNSEMIVNAFLSAILNSRKKGMEINTDIVGELSKYLNLLGGVYILDCLPYKIIYEKTVQKLQELTGNKSLVV